MSRRTGNRRDSRDNTSVDDDESNWFWSKRDRGGGGAPLRDPSGDIITNLKNVLVSGGRDSTQRNKKDEIYDHDDEYDDHDENIVRRRRKEREREKDRDSRRLHFNDEDDDEDRDNRSRRDNKKAIESRRMEVNDSPNGSPKKFMSALREMNGGLDRTEREAKLRSATLTSTLAELIIINVFI